MTNSSKHNIFISGSTGLLGNSLLNEINSELYQITLGSRKDPQIKRFPYNWISFNLDNLTEKLPLEGIKTIIHMASGTKKYNHQTDVNGTQKLLKDAKEHGVQHFIYISIVGVDKMPIKYFRIKRQVEKEIENSGLPFTILRATQFFEFFEEEVKMYTHLPVAIMPGKILYQPIETPIVARKLLTIANNEPQNKIIEIGGSEKILLNDATKIWLSHHQLNKPIINIPLMLLGKLGKMMRGGVLTTDKVEKKSSSWKQWLETKK